MQDFSIIVDSQKQWAALCGTNGENLKTLEEVLGGHIDAWGNEIRAAGVDEERFRAIISALLAVIQTGDNPSTEHVRALANGGAPQTMQEAVIAIPQGFRRVYPRSANQASYIRGMRSCDISFCVGPAGTGKTYLAIAEALRLVLSKKVRKLVLTRPVVEAGESLGFLPGDLNQKINPYLRPLYDAMENLIPFELLHRMEEGRAIEIAPLAYMRGRSLNEAVIILDEAQNTTKEQMKMFLTRLGNASRAVVTGDITQIDLPKHVESGLVHALDILSHVDGIHITWLHTTDVVRNPLIKKIIDAYNHEKKTIA
ncbi:putative phosphate starvation-inducible protein PhoH [Pillotina sp. SPG140]